MLQKFHSFLKKFIEQKGQGVVEYALILGFVAILAVYLIGKSDLDGKIQQNVQDATDVSNKYHEAYNSATGA